jgi:hypothetical protein
MDDGRDEDGDPALARVRSELAHLGSDASSAPEAPAEVTARVGAALRSAGRGPVHSVRPPRLRRRRLGLCVGVCTALVGVLVGVGMLSDSAAPTVSRGPTARMITVPTPMPNIPLSDPQILALLDAPPDYGALADPQRRAACLDGLGYGAATAVLGARRLDVAGKPAVLLVLPAPDAVTAVLVEPDCSAAHAGVLARKQISRVSRR